MKRFALFLSVGAIVMLLASAAMGAIVAVCHVPPGNPAKAKTVLVGRKAADAHLKNHSGDFLGFCPACQVDEDCANDTLCDNDFCVDGECLHIQLGCPINPCLADAFCIPETGECVEVPEDCSVAPPECCGDDDCDIATGECVPPPVFCTEDVFTCEDGTVVGRVPPDCEFADCPTR